MIAFILLSYWWSWRKAWFLWYIDSCLKQVGHGLEPLSGLERTVIDHFAYHVGIDVLMCICNSLCMLMNVCMLCSASHVYTYTCMCIYVCVGPTCMRECMSVFPLPWWVAKNIYPVEKTRLVLQLLIRHTTGAGSIRSSRMETSDNIDK